MSEKTYLGDGLYASHDGFMFCLSAEQPHGEQKVYLEPQIVDAFLRFIESTYKIKITAEKVPE